MATPAWLAATSGYNAYAGQVNQFLGAHAITYVYQGQLQANQETLGSGSVSSDGLWIAQSFTTAAGQSAVGWVAVAVAVTGSPSPWVVSLQASVSGAPSGTPLASTSFPHEFADGSFNFCVIMLPVTGLTASTGYWIVAESTGDASDYFAWNKSNQASGASTSATGTSWAAQSYGLLYQVWDQTPVPPLAGTWEDSGARWTVMTYSGGQLAGILEWTAGQSATGYAVSSRGLSYTDGKLAGVA